LKNIKILSVLSLLFFVIVCNVSAIEVIGQDDVVYLGETVDISLAVSWPDYTIAWCSNEGYICDPPEQIIAVTGNMHKYYIDPNKFNKGTYYRWNGKWNNAENQNAFVVRIGNRTSATPTPTPTSNEITLEGNVSRLITSDTSIVIARGDSGRFEYYNPDVYGDGHLWLFGGDSDTLGGTHMELDISISRTNDSYYYDFTPEFTNRMSNGIYTGYLQFNGRNGFQDCYYIPKYKTPFNATYPVLESIYKAVPMVDLSGFVPVRVQSEFEKMVFDKKYSDDIIVPISMRVMYPMITIKNYYESNDTIFVDGTLSLNAEATLTAVVDPGHYPLPKDLEANTYTAKIEGDITNLRNFTLELPIRWGELSIGEHPIVFSAYGSGNDLKAEQILILPVSDVWIMPTPTPKRERVVVEEYGWHRVIPVQINTTATITTIPTQMHLGNITHEGVNETKQNVTTTTTTAKPTLTPTKTMVVPVESVVGVIAVGLAIVIFRRE